MFKEIVQNFSLPGQDQPLTIIVSVTRIEFTLGNCQVDYSIGLPGESGTVLREGTYNFNPPVELTGGLEATFKQMMQGLLSKIKPRPENFTYETVHTIY